MAKAGCQNAVVQERAESISNRKQVDQMNQGDKVGIVCCSNGRPHTQTGVEKTDRLECVLREMGLIPVFSDYIYEKEDGSPFSGSGKERADGLMRFYQDPQIAAIFDISGGDIANEILPYLDFAGIEKSGKQFWGYSDLTAVINAVYAKTGKSSVLYQVRNLIGTDAKNQIRRFSDTVLGGGKSLYLSGCNFLQKERMQGIVVGGNIRCLLKLAGTPFWPDMREKILLLEGFHGGVAQLTAYFAQLQQMGVFAQINGLLLGTFTELEQKGYALFAAELAKQFAGADIPVARTGEIGHGADAKAIVIGRELILQGALC